MRSRRVTFAVLLLLLLVVSLVWIYLAGSAVSDSQGNISERAPVSISIMANLHTQIIPSDQIEKLIEEKTNTQLSISWVPDGSYDEKVYASLATGMLPKVLYLKNAASLSHFRDDIRSGIFWEIGPYLEQYPNLRQLKPEVLNNTTIDGKLYTLYQERPLARQGIIYRKDWADALGLSAPDTLDDLYEMLKGFTYGDPDGNGLDDTLGLADRNDLIYGAFKTISSYFGAPNNWGWYNDSLQPEFVFPQYRETMKWFRKLHTEGLINADFAITSKTDQQELFVTGKAGVYIGAMGDVLTLESRLRANDKSATLDVHNRVRGPEKYGIWASQGYVPLSCFRSQPSPQKKSCMKCWRFSMP
ncbi:lipoprotein [Paenibacillus sp. JCM 10914]|nr:lipoprotein [Paenibacillus sp. JCM 10914]